MRLGRTAAVAVAGLLLAPPALFAQDARVDIAGRAVDAATGEPVEGVVIAIPALGRDAVSNASGGFRFAGLPAGLYRFHLVRLGYVTAIVAVEVERTGTLVFHLIAKPIVLEGIEVVLDRLEDRRRSIPYAVRAFGPERLGRLGSPSLEDFVRHRSGVPFVNCPRRRGSLAPPRRDCVLSRGRGLPLQVWVNETPQLLGIEILGSYSPRDIHTLEVIPGCEMIRVYTHDFMEGVAEGRRNLMVSIPECWF